MLLQQILSNPNLTPDYVDFLIMQQIKIVDESRKMKIDPAIVPKVIDFSLIKTV